MTELEGVPEPEAMRGKLIPLALYRQLLNGPEFISGWQTVDQSMIDMFADATRDRQFIHTDIQRAEEETLVSSRYIAIEPRLRCDARSRGNANGCQLWV